MSGEIPYQVRVAIEDENGQWISLVVRPIQTMEYEREIRAAADELVSHLVRNGLRYG